MYKNAIITGASDGLGKELAIQLAKKGIKNIAICGRNAIKLQAVVDILKSHQTNVYFESFDLSDTQRTQLFFNNVIQTFQTVDLLINNAGSNTKKSTLVDLSIDELNYMMQLNCISPALLMRESIKEMTKHKYGLIINILSTVCKHDIPEFCGYTASKKAFEAINHTTRKAVKNDNISILAVYPGGMNTNFRDEQRPTYLNPHDVANIIIKNIDTPENCLMQELLIRPISENNY